MPARERPERERLHRKSKFSGSDEADKPTDIKATIRKMIIDWDNPSVQEIHQALEKRGIEISKIAISGVRAEFRETLRQLQKLGLID